MTAVSGPVTPPPAADRKGTPAEARLTAGAAAFAAVLSTVRAVQGPSAAPVGTGLDGPGRDGTGAAPRGEDRLASPGGKRRGGAGRSADTSGGAGSDAILALAQAALQPLAAAACGADAVGDVRLTSSAGSPRSDAAPAPAPVLPRTEAGIEPLGDVPAASSVPDDAASAAAMATTLAAAAATVRAVQTTPAPPLHSAADAAPTSAAAAAAGMPPAQVPAPPAPAATIAAAPPSAEAPPVLANAASPRLADTSSAGSTASLTQNTQAPPSSPRATAVARAAPAPAMAAPGSDSTGSASPVAATPVAAGAGSQEEAQAGSGGRGGQALDRRGAPPASPAATAGDTASGPPPATPASQVLDLLRSVVTIAGPDTAPSGQAAPDATDSDGTPTPAATIKAGSVTLELSPAGLGRVTVTVRMNRTATDVHIAVDNKETLAALSADKHLLSSALGSTHGVLDLAYAPSGDGTTPPAAPGKATMADGRQTPADANPDRSGRGADRRGVSTTPKVTHDESSAVPAGRRDDSLYL